MYVLYKTLIFCRYSRLEADRFLQTLMTGFENCKVALLQSLKRKSERETQLYQQVVALKSRQFRV